MLHFLFFFCANDHFYESCTDRQTKDSLEKDAKSGNQRWEENFRAGEIYDAEGSPPTPAFLEENTLLLGHAHSLDRSIDRYISPRQ